MAQYSIVKSFLVAVIVVVFSAAATSAQELAPAPAPDAGAGFSLAQSGALELAPVPAPNSIVGYCVLDFVRLWIFSNGMNWHYQENNTEKQTNASETGNANPSPVLSMPFSIGGVGATAVSCPITVDEKSSITIITMAMASKNLITELPYCAILCK
ncbi:hypothetical protein FXO37_06838 [Capsicum annuum]|nr:hypothetical protein FXO37_06838 [Capsicum annuum]